MGRRFKPGEPGGGAMSLPVLRTQYDALPAKFTHAEGQVELRLQCFLLVRDAQERVCLAKIEGIEGWCIPAETMRVNESPDQAATRVARSWFQTPMQLWLERVLSFPATGPQDNRWYVIFVYGADAPADLKGTPDTLEMGFFPLAEPPGPLGMSHGDVWNALR